MKIRSDFVTNSSSSSFVIAYKTIPEFDPETIAKYPILTSFNTIIEKLLFSGSDNSETTKGNKITTKEELDAYYMDTWGWRDATLEVVLEESEVKDQYDQCLEALEHGETILMKYVDYNDDTTYNMLKELDSGNTGIRILFDE